MITINWIFEHKNDIYEMSVDALEYPDGGFTHILKVNGADAASWHWARTFPPVITKAKGEYELKAML